MKKFILCLAVMAAATAFAAKVSVGKWQVFFSKTGVVTAENAKQISLSGKMPAGSKNFRLLRNFINFKSMCPNYKVGKDVALVHTTIKASENCEIFFGTGSDWYLTMFLNGEQLLSTEGEAGNFYFPIRPSNYPVKFKLKKGVNHLAFFLRPGVASWGFAFGKVPSVEGWPANPDEQEAWFRALFAKPRDLRVAPYLTDIAADSAIISLEFHSPIAAAIRIRPENEKKFGTPQWTLRDGLRVRQKLHRFQLKDLKPDTRYFYEVVILHSQLAKYPVIASGSFRTGKKSGLNHKMMILSDTQISAHNRRKAFYDAAKAMPDAAMIVSLGDTAGAINNAVEVFFDTTIDGVRDATVKIVKGKNKYGWNTWQLKGDMMPVLMVRGNHEYRGDEIELFSHYFGSPYKAFSVGDVFYIVLDTGEDKRSFYTTPRHYTLYTDTKAYFAEQQAWLRKVIESPACKNAKRRIVLTHGIPFSRYRYMYDRLMDITGGVFFGADPKCKVDLWISGHTHQAFRYDPADKLIFGVDVAKKELKRASEEDIKNFNFPVFINDGPGGEIFLTRIELLHDEKGIDLICRKTKDNEIIDHIRIEPGKPVKVKKTSFVKW